MQTGKRPTKRKKQQIIIDLEPDHFTLTCSEDMYTYEIADVMLSVLEYLSSLEGNTSDSVSSMLQ